jgi:hypothetical protein
MSVRSSSLISDRPVALVQQGRDLLLPGGGAEWKAVDEYHRLPGTMILVVQIDGRGVLHADSQIGHPTLLFPRVRARRDIVASTGSVM